MKKKFIIGITSITAGLLAVLGVSAAAGSAPSAPLMGPPAFSDPEVPSAPRDLGVGEGLLLVVADGFYRTQSEAEAANQAFAFGELQGFYAVPTAQFDGLRESVGTLGDWALVSAFRTQAGAESFAETAVSAGARVQVTPRLTSLPGVYAGLGQEAAPDGLGPLRGPIAQSLPTMDQVSPSTGVDA